MSEITKPILLNETGQETNQKLDTLAAKEQLIADAINNVAQNYTDIHAAAVSAQQQATAAAASAAAADNSADDAADSAAAAAQKLDDLETFLSGLDPESAASVAAELGLFEQEVASDYAKKDGYYEQMGVGTADNLAGHGSVNAEYTYRTAGGDSDIGTGAAAIDTVKGNTLVWNQLIKTDQWSTSSVPSGITATNNGDGSFTLNGTASASGYIRQSVGSGLVGKKVYISLGIANEYLGISEGTSGAGFGDKSRVITFGNSTYIYVYINSGASFSNVKIYPTLHDLTKMFGSGYEPSTVAEFEALYPLNYYDYNSGTLINNAASGIKTIGFNQWDEQWELGSLDNVGNNTNSTTQIRSKNYIPIFPSTNYYYNNKFGVHIQVAYYDADKNFIGWETGTSNVPFLAQSKSNARYIRFRTNSTVTAYTPGQLCINLSWSGYRNGEYEPYEEHTVYFDSDLGASGSLATIKGRKFNAQGEPTGDSVVVFEDGLKVVGYGTDIGNVLYDEAKGQIATKRIIKVDLGSLTYNQSGEVFYVSGFATTYGVMISRIKCARFEYNGYAYSTSDSPDNTIKIDGNTNLYIHCSSYSTPEAFKTAMNGVYAYCCLTTPETYLLDNPLPVNYVVNDFGTEQRLPADTSSSVMAPILYSVQYAMNATDTIRRLPINYISKDSFENFCASLASAIGPYLNPPATIAVTPTYNDNTHEYDYQVTVTPTENNG